MADKKPERPMKFTIEMNCSCGGHQTFSAYGNNNFGSATCTKCGTTGHLFDPLSVSVTAERLLYRSRVELENGDYSLSIVVAVIAIESYLTRLFLKLKGMDSYATTFMLPTEKQEAEWEGEYPRSGGFPGPIGFISKRLLGTTFDKFAAEDPSAAAIFSTLPDTSNTSATDYFQNKLFKPRNRIIHWGYVNSGKADAELCHKIAVALVSILREMDRSKYGHL
jgi:hypothetical protein